MASTATNGIGTYRVSILFVTPNGAWLRSSTVVKAANMTEAVASVPNGEDVEVIEWASEVEYENRDTLREANRAIAVARKRMAAENRRAAMAAIIAARA